MKSDKGLYIYGRNPIREALDNNRIIEVYVSSNFSDTKLLDALKTKKIPMINKSINELNKMVDGVHQGIVALMKRYEYSSLEDILRDQTLPYQGLRLVQGDVGCGKTVVAMMAMLKDFLLLAFFSRDRARCRAK